MTDRELLEAAARAAGNGAVWYGSLAMGIEEGGALPKFWRPLDDDGDALRLAVAVGVDIVFAQKGMTRVYAKGHEFTEYCGEDPYAATRRAIVRAAAEIGRQQEQSKGK